MNMTKAMGKCNAGIASAFGGMKRTAKNTRQESRIAEAENKIAQLTEEIGNLTVIALDAGMEGNEAITERYNAILEARQQIQMAQTEKQALYVSCPHCGKRTAVGMRFCGHCGKEL